MSGVVVILEYAQALLLLVYYWIKALGRLLIVQNIQKNVENEIILVTGAGLFNKTYVDFFNDFLFFFRFWTWSRCS
jgi:hypothetical protein